MNRKLKNTTKDERKSAVLRKLKQENLIQLALKKSNGKNKSFKMKLETVYNNKGEWKQNDIGIEYNIIRFFNQLSTKKKALKRQVFYQLLVHLERVNCKTIVSNAEFITGLFMIATNDYSIIRPIEMWKRNSHNPAKQFSSLLRHLFCNYNVPKFLDSAWLTESEPNQAKWLIALGQGSSVRKLEKIPIGFTKKIAHQFAKAPDNLSVSQALRWAQIIGQGGDEQLAKFVYRSPIGRNGFENESFWNLFIRFLVKKETQFAFDYHKIDELVDYLNYKRIENNEYNLNGRTIATLIRASNEWHNEQGLLRNRGGEQVWNKSGIEEFETVEGKDEKQITYQILELLSTNELIAEGKKMHHCVAMYTRVCSAKRSAIFSIRKLSHFGFEEILATIEISLHTKTIVQAKGKRNKVISGKSNILIQKWANTENIVLPNWIVKT